MKDGLDIPGLMQEIGARAKAASSELAFAAPEAKAQAMTLAGQVVVGDHLAEKAGQAVAPDVPIRLKGEFNPYVSRGGLKLEAALAGFPVDPTGLTCVDVGASTGGFTSVAPHENSSRAVIPSSAR